MKKTKKKRKVAGLMVSLKMRNYYCMVLNFVQGVPEEDGSVSVQVRNVGVMKRS